MEIKQPTMEHANLFNAEFWSWNGWKEAEAKIKQINQILGKEEGKQDWKN